MTETESHTVPLFRALSMMEKQLMPLRHGREPYWRPPVPAPAHSILVPSWNWRSVHEVPEGNALLTLDVNGAFLGSMGHVPIAHGNLKPTGAWDYLPAPGTVPTGYYKITVPYWAFSGTIVNPLGDNEQVTSETSLWIARPTLVLLLELMEEGSIGDFGIIDSWTCPTQTTFRSWQGRLKVIRNQLLDALDNAHPGGRPEKCECLACARYTAFKEGYSSALSMMLTGENCHTMRPDWAHHVRAEHAAASWRKAWRYTATGRTLIGMGATDEITIIREDLPEVLGMSKPPFRVDRSGRALGAFKYKSKPTPAPDTRPVVLALADDQDDIL